MRWRRAPALSLLGLLAAAPLGAAPPARGGIEIPSLNRTYSGLDGSGAPVREGLLAVRLSSPDAQVTVHRNRLVLTPQAGGDPHALLLAELEGEGDLVADVEGGPLATRLQDRVAAPRQVVRVEGRARVTREPDAYRVALTEAPPSTPVEIRSGVVAQIAGVCRGMVLVAALDCGRLERSLSTFQVPIRPGRSLRIPREQLTPAQRAYLDRFVAF